MPIIRSACLTVASKWQPPAPEEVQSLLLAIRKRTGLSPESQVVADLLGLGHEGCEAVSDWLGGRAIIPYTCWAMLCEMAGLGLIWRVGERPSLLSFD
ncbi:MAG: transcriptional regulator [Dehalococcoidia bacterium]